MELKDLFGVEPGILLASGFGSVLRLTFAEKMPPARALGGIGVGFCFAAYFTPIVADNRWWQLKSDAAFPIAFSLGLIGTIVVEKFLKWAQTVDLGSLLFDRLLRRESKPDATKEDKPKGNQ